MGSHEIAIGRCNTFLATFKIRLSRIANPRGHQARGRVVSRRQSSDEDPRLHPSQRHLFSEAHVPVVVEIVDSEEKINSFLPILDDMMESGLVTLEVAKVLQYSRERAGLLQRIKQQFGRPSHAA
jgi:hypothetical protein